LLQFVDSVLSLGAFSLSFCFDFAIQVVLVHDVVSLKAFFETSLVQAAQCDAIVLDNAHRELLDGNLDNLLEVDREIMNRK
ncbi:urease accessory protein UreF, partial [Klebsiella pneumoniae]|nr:urease accessory protein UreF [Klebsiella pneumoniae]